MNKKRIFVVEDESIVSLEIQTRLKTLGYEIAGSAASGEEAIRKIIASKPDLILMDIRIKGNIDGIETAAEVRKHLETPVIFLTAYADETTLQRAKITDPFGYIIKPFEERELSINIEIALYKDQTQKLLREKDKWLSTILKSIGDAVIATDQYGKIRFINKAATELTGYSEAEAIGNDLSLVFNIRSEMTKKVVENPFQKVMQSGEIVGLANHTELISKEGNIYPIADSGSPIRDTNGNIDGVVIVFQDLSYYKKAEEQIKLQTSALNSAYNGVVITDETGKIIWNNDAMERLTGYTADELLYNDINILRSESQDKQIYKEIWDAITNGKVWRGELINRKKNGEDYFEEMTITPLKDEQDKTINFISIKDDITDRKRKEGELKKAKEDAERSDRLKSEFLAQMSHEIRTPINIISNFMQIYEDELRDKLSSELKNSISAVKTESHRIISTIDSIINMAQLKAGTFNRKQQELNLYDDIIKPSIEQWKFLAAEKNIELIICEEIESIFIKGDAYSLSQSINHIVDNAIKYTDMGEVQIECKSEEKNVIVTISDTGCGISEEYLPIIFDPFTQELQGYNRKYEGNGLGMALVKQYCNLNNASITIKSKKMAGTVVKVSIPKINKGG